MPIGQITSNSGLVGTLVLDSKSLNNTGISSRQIKPINLAGESAGNSFAPPPAAASSTGLELSPSVQSYNFVGKLTSSASAPAAGSILSVVA